MDTETVLITQFSAAKRNYQETTKSKNNCLKPIESNTALPKHIEPNIE